MKTKTAFIWLTIGCLIGTGWTMRTVQADITAMSSFRVGEQGYVCKDVRSIDAQMWKK